MQRQDAAQGRANCDGVSEMSEQRSTLVSGPETGLVVDAVRSVLEALGGGAGTHAAAALDRAIAEVGAAAVVHHLDVAGRALARDLAQTVDDDRDCGIDWAAVAASLPSAGIGAEDLRAIVHGWIDGAGLTVTIDLVADELDLRDGHGRTLAALVAVAALVQAAGFPPEVVI